MPALLSATLPLLLSPALALSPRAPLPPMPLHRVEQPGAPVQAWRLTVKMRDDARVRARPDGGLWSETGADLGPILALARSEGLRFRPLIPLDPQRILAVQARAEARTGSQAADLQGMLVVEGPAVDRLETLGARLQALDVVEYAFIEAQTPPPPGDIGTTTSDFTSLQTWLDEDPGLNVRAVWALGYTGVGVKVSDVEYGWGDTHEDLMDRTLTMESGQTVPSWVARHGWDEHGTAVVGQIAAVDNGYGMTGGAHGVEIGVYPEYTDAEGSRRPAAITSAIADSAEGDVILLEMQVATRPGGNYGPAELDPNVFTVVQTGVDAGVTIVGAAGNGAEDLDSRFYASNYLTWGDSGAIIVGAGSADANHDIVYFSTYGSRVNVQGWGLSIVTLGYGDLAAVDRDKKQYYTREFGGTSGASPMVTLVSALLQGYARAELGGPIDPWDLRELLVSTGIPQGTGGNIGPFPDALAAMEALGAGDGGGTGDGGSGDGGSGDGGSGDGGTGDGGSGDGGTDGGGTGDGGGDGGTDGGGGDGGADDGGGASADGGGDDETGKGCGQCATGGLGPAMMLGLVGLAGARRRRRG